MGANIITGYTGTRHITPAMDAAVYRSTFGPNSYILSDGNQLAGSMPSVNEFTVLDGLVSMQGHQIQVTQETLSVDTCANGYKRIDLVCMRFEHDNNSQIDSASLIVIKGAEVADPNNPVVPDYNTGDIDSGASVVDFPLYQINLAGSSVTFTQVAEIIQSTIEGLDARDYIVEQGTSGIWTYRKWNSGVAECWGYYSINNVSAGATFSPLVVRTFSGYITLPSGLFTAHPQAFASGQWGSQYSVVSVQSTTFTEITLSLMSMSAGNLTAHLYAIGKWN